MKSTFHVLSTFRVALPGAVLALAGFAAQAQAVPQITSPVNDTELSTLTGNVHPLAQAAYDTGAVPANTATGRLILTLKRSAAQETALRQFLSDVQTKGNPSYHKWLTPAQFGQQFGVSDSDLAQVQTWLQSQGFTVDKVGAGRTAIEFSGTTGQVSTAFHTSLHTYAINGETHHANATNPRIPSALASVIAGVTRLNDFHPKSQAHLLGRAKYDAASRTVKPEWTIGSGSGAAYAMGPADFATQYDVTPLYGEGLNGTGQTLGIINDSNIDLGIVQNYRALFGLDANPSQPNLPHIIIDGNDPGVTSDSTEAYLDVEMSGAVARLATVNLYIAADTDYDDGLDLAILRAVEDDTAPVLSLSFGTCEPAAGAGYLAYISSVWEQAAAQGQTVMVSTGDSGSAGCDNENNPFPASLGLQVNGLASTPWNIAVGGTDFYYSDYATGGASMTQDWSATNSASLGSLLKPLPEQPWNDSNYGLDVFVAEGTSIASGGGGQSTCAVVNGPLEGQNPITSEGLCIGLGGVPKPAWQSGPGVPADGVRDLPDLSLFAANGLNNSFFAICAEAGDCVDSDPSSGTLYYTGIGGTSAAAPAFAGIMALVNERYGPQGQANTTLYPLAAQFPAAFHDVTVGSNNVPCGSGSVGCKKDASGGGYSLQDWPATVGYDLASGLGSIDASVLLSDWSSVKFTGSSVAFSVSPTTITHGATVNLATTVVASSGSTIPTGAVAVTADTTLPANKGQIEIPLDPTGSGEASVNTLPGGTYTLQGNYSGDVNFSSSQSAPVTVTVNPEASSLLTSAFYFQTSPYTTFPLISPVTYGTIVGIDVQVANAAGTVDGIATGTVTVMDNGSAIATLPLNATGATVYSSGTWALGSHSITFSYSGDPSYNATTTMKPQSPVTFMVGQGTASISLIANSSSLPIGGTFVLQIAVSGSDSGLSPTGTVTVTLGSLTKTVTLAPTFTSESIATATFTNLPAGNYPVSVTYSGNANWSGTSVTGNPLTVAASTLLTPTISVTSNPANLSNLTPGTLITLTATLHGSGTAPTGDVLFVTDGQVFSSNNNDEIPVVSGTGGTSTASISFAAGNAYGGTNQVYVLYFGDQNYNSSSSPVLMFNNNQGDFAILANNPTVTVASGASGTAALTLSAGNQFSGNVKLSCAVTGPGNSLPQCTVPASMALSPTGQVAVSVKFTTTLSGSMGMARPERAGWWLRGGEVTAAACLLFFFLPSRRRRPAALLGIVAAIAFASAIMGCSGSQQTIAPAPTGVPAGTYQAVITATNGVTTHNAVVMLQVTVASSM
ncbi:Ig-like domain repeat protein [Terracidiphilus sp.]|uniref:Ig-like domain repeat protein n=1 Tax=Terracidiphilus sp. TaxID=1964191 RepID=UPI003C2A8853